MYMAPNIWQLLITFFTSGIGFGFPFILALLFIQKKEYSQLSGNEKYAGFWNRFLAGIIDSIILFVSILVITLLIRTFVPHFIYYNLLVLFFSLFYYVLFQRSSRQATPGMMVLGIKIYDEQFQRVGFWRLTGRYFSTFISGIIIGIGYFMIGW